MSEYLEVWKDIKDYEGIYQVSSFGRVKSLKRIIYFIRKSKPSKRIANEFIIKTNLKKGYVCLMLHDNGIDTNYSVHRLVANAFVPNPENKPEVNHIDGNKLNNNDWNLEWNTKSENIVHAYSTGLMKIRTGKDIYISKQIICKTTKLEFESIKDASEYLGIHRTTLSKMLLGTLKNKTTMIYL